MGEQVKPLSALGLTARSGRSSNGGSNPMISGIAVDSREVKDGFLFAAMPIVVDKTRCSLEGNCEKSDFWERG